MGIGNIGIVLIVILALLLFGRTSFFVAVIKKQYLRNIFR